jgi:hypothetical protein
MESRVFLNSSFHPAISAWYSFAAVSAASITGCVRREARLDQILFLPVRLKQSWKGRMS